MNWIMDQENEFEYHKEFLNPSGFIDTVKKMQFSEITEMANKVYNWDTVNIGCLLYTSPSPRD